MAGCRETTMSKRTWPKPPKPDPNAGNVCTGWRVSEPDETPMHDRGISGAAPSWESPRPTPTLCKHGLGSCETCGTTTRREARHTTSGGKGAVARLKR